MQFISKIKKILKIKVKKRYVLFFVIFLLFLIIYLITNPILNYDKKSNGIFINKENLISDVRFLTSINPPRNNLNPDSLNQGADYILEEFKKTGCELSVQEFFIGKKEYKNIICSFGVKNSERLIVGAHYDVSYDTPGADDNASGVAGILELARVFERENLDLKYRVDFVAYSLEEPFFGTESMGSAKHSEYLKNNNIKVLGMISLEMIGFFSNEKDSQKYPSSVFKLFYPSKGDFLAVVGKIEQQGMARKIKRNIVENSDISTFSINAPSFLPGIDFSDHLNYWNRGYQAVMITDTSFYRNPDYHKEGDVIEKLDFDKMKEAVRGIYFAIINF